MASPRERCLPASWLLTGGTQPGVKLVPNEGLKVSIGHFKRNQGRASVPPKLGLSLLFLSFPQGRDACLRDRGETGRQVSGGGTSHGLPCLPTHPGHTSHR